MDWYQIASALLGLPALLIVLLLLGLLVHIRMPRTGVVIVWLAAALLVALSLPLTAHRIVRHLENFSPPALPVAQTTVKGSPSPVAVTNRPGAIVVLGGGRYADAPEYGGDTVNRYTLERLRYAAYLHRQSRLPILVAAGSVHDEPVSEGEAMRIALTRDFGVPVKWAETRSHTTFENALFSRRILQEAQIRHVYLVTHAWHMRRAILVFKQAGIEVTPAPVGYSTLGQRDFGVIGYLPSATALLKSSQAIHEIAGYWWYRHLLRSGQMEAPVSAGT